MIFTAKNVRTTNIGSWSKWLVDGAIEAEMSVMASLTAQRRMSSKVLDKFEFNVEHVVMFIGDCK